MTEDDRQKILEALMAGETSASIGRRLGLSKNYALQLAKRRGHISPTKARIARGWQRARMIAVQS